MNRQVRHALLTPLLVGVVAVPSTMAAQAAPAPAAAPGVVPQATCQLKTAAGTNPVEFDLVLAGFRAGQQVKINGPERLTRNVSGAGALTVEDVKKGNYTVWVGQGRNARRTDCTRDPRPPAPPPAVKISGADITGASTTPAEVNCSQPQNVTFTGKLTGSNTGNVDYIWQSGAKRVAPELKFTAPETPVVSFVVRSPTRAAPADPVPKVSAQLVAMNASDEFTFTLKCAPGT
ncbi:hypothetical protein [Streptomyces sp. NPDC002054]|uniref:hypothetical protein n=1 Tax=Streptomyces sp. NPDC002054 TaxID=3154663 RepID=UPI00331D654D